MKPNLLTTIIAFSSLLLLCGCEEEDTVTENNPRAAAGATLLKADIPPEHPEGTARPIKNPPTGLLPKPTSAPTLLVPEDTILLSRGKKVTSSDDDPFIGSLDLITDADKDAGDGYYVELMNGTQWVQIDLESNCTIDAVWIWHFHAEIRSYHDVVVQVSDDPDFKTAVTTIYNNDYDNSSQLGKGRDRPYRDTRFGLLADGRGAHGRYVRLYSRGNVFNDMNHYIEVEVFGRPVE